MEKINTEEERIIVKKTAYKAIDGTVFDTESDCVKYEFNLVKPLKVYLDEFGLKDCENGVYVNHRMDYTEVTYQDSAMLIRFTNVASDAKCYDTLCYPSALCKWIAIRAKVRRDYSWPENGEFNHGHYSPQVIIKSGADPYVIENGKLLDVVAGIEDWKNTVLPKLKGQIDMLEKYRKAYDDATEEYAKKLTSVFFGMPDVVKEVNDMLDDTAAYSSEEAWNDFVKGLI